jgi:hypothetical protein
MSKQSSQSVKPYLSRKTFFVVLHTSQFPVLVPISRMFLERTRRCPVSSLLTRGASRFFDWRGNEFFELHVRRLSGCFKLALTPFWQTNGVYLSSMSIYNLLSTPNKNRKNNKTRSSLSRVASLNLTLMISASSATKFKSGFLSCVWLYQRQDTHVRIGRMPVCNMRNLALTKKSQ